MNMRNFMKNYKFAVVAVLLPAVSFIACSGKSSSVGADAKENFYFSLPTPSGSVLDLNSFKGKPALVFFWSINCGYCRQAMPYLEQIYGKYKSRGFSVIGVNEDPSDTPVLEAMKFFNITFPVVIDSNGGVFEKLGMRGVPIILVLDKSLAIEKKWMGYHPSFHPEIESSIEKLLTI